MIPQMMITIMHRGVASAGTYFTRASSNRCAAVAKHAIRAAAATLAAAALASCHRAVPPIPVAPPVPATYFVKIETTKGTFDIVIHRDWAPKGAERFHQLVLAKFFDDSRFFRVRERFIAQFGVAGKPSMAQRWRTAAFPDDSVRHSNVRGTIAFAMTGPNTRTTQLYINLVDNPQLDAQGFAPMGEIARPGMDVVDKLYAGYGETSGGGMRAGNQQKLFELGNAWLDKEFPLLDRLIRASLSQ